MSDLGRLTPVALRDIWQSEAQDFTPWLAREDNLALLGEAIGIELELEAVERNVGPFRADILCKDTARDTWVLVENQLERTDHTHLGQLMTYAAGLDAVTIVWVAARVAEEHRAAIDWLNDKTDADMRFFAIEVELWRIGDSPAAPRFNIVSKPNDFSKSAHEGRRAVETGELSDMRRLQLDYWNTVEARLGQETEIRPVAGQPQPWVTHGIGKTGVGLVMSTSSRDNVVRAEIYLTGTSAKNRFSVLRANREAIEAELGFPLDWRELPGGSDSRIASVLLNSDPSNKGDWDRQHNWLIGRMRDFDRVFRARVKALP